ncbi:MAG: MFS transporter [Dermatophilaceae bacterium]
MRTPTRILVSHALAATAMGAAWPLLLAAVWSGTGSAWWLGAAGAARMAPYVLCSWWVGHFADRFSRSRIVTGTLVARVVLLAASGLALWADRLGLAVLVSALVVVVATPAYPALVAGLPAVPGARARTTEWLVTIEVCSFVVGPAIGGLLLGVPGLVIPLATGATAVAWLVMRGVDLPAPRRAPGRVRTGWRAVLATSPQARRTLGLLAMINFVLAGVGIALLPMATDDWAAPWSTETAFGIGTAVLGFGALGAPLLVRLGRGPVRRTLCGLALMSAGIVLLGLAPAVLAALPALGLVGAAAVHAESNATRHLQDLIPDDSRASVFGLGDTAMVGAALAGSLAAPPIAEMLGARVLLVAVAVALVALSGLIRAVQAPAAQQIAPV